MSWVHEHRFPDAVALAHALAGEIKVDLEEAIAVRGTASLVVSGGRTPIKLFEQLRTEALDWSKVWITLADERWVETTAPASNEKFVRETLLTGRAAAAHFVGLKNPAPAPEAGADWATRALTRVPHPFDVVLLGMGDDGHTASLFPGSLALNKALDRSAAPGCIAINSLTAPHAAESESCGVTGCPPRHIAYRGGDEVAGLSAGEGARASGGIAGALDTAAERSARRRVLGALIAGHLT